MNKSTYNPKLDPKSTSYQPNAAKVSVEVPATPASATKSESDATTQQNRQNAKANYQGTPAVQGVASVDEKSSSAMISEGGHIMTGTKLHLVREPSNLTDTLPASPEVPAAKEDSEIAPVQAAKPSM